MRCPPLNIAVVPFGLSRVDIQIRENAMSVLIIDGLHRDVLRNRSFVTVTWKGEPEKSLGLPVPFDCQLDNLKRETEKAVIPLAKELESATIEGP
jgi:hypothetical protein